MKEYRGLILPSEPQYERKASGYIIMDNGNGPVETAATLQCVHCNKHFISIKGSGTIRAFCLKCGGVTCGAPVCHEHYDFRKKLDDYEQGKLGVLR
jgi:hypothetical protein